MPIRRLNTINRNKRTLLDFVGYRSIQQFRRENPEYRSNDSAYRSLLGMYNDEVDRLNIEEERLRVQQLRIRREQARLQARLQANMIKEYYKEKQDFKGRDKYNFLEKATKIATKDEAKYNNERGVFIREVKVKYNCQIKQDNGEWSSPFRAYRSEFVIGNSRANVIQKANIMGQRLIDALKNISPELNSNFDVSYGTIYTSNNRVQIKNIRMRNAQALKLNDEDLPEWDLGTGRCIYDALIHIWKDPKSRMTKKANYEWLNNFFTDEDNPNPEEDGISIHQLESLARREDFTLYAFNINNKLLSKHKATKGSQKPAFVFKLWNNHIYPIDDVNERASIIRKNADTEKIKHNNLVNDKKKYAKQSTKTYTNVIPENNDCIGNDFAVKYIFENNTVPYPFTSKEINYDKGHIRSMKIGDKHIFTQPIEKDIVDYLDKTGEEYNGQHYFNLLTKFWQETYGGELKDNDMVSQMNPITSNYFNADNVKNRVHIGSLEYIDDIQQKIDDEEIVGADIIKCYSSILDKPMDNWITYELTDEVENYDGELKTGLYFVETNDLTLFHKTNWYSNTIVQYATEQNIEYKIIKQYIPKKQKHNKHYFKDIIDTVSEECGMKLTKNIINTITGMLGKTKSSSYTTSITTDINEVWDSMNNHYDKLDEFFVKMMIHNEKTLFVYGFKKKSNIYTNNLPMYIQILDQSNIKLHKLSVLLGGRIIYRKTDAVVMLGGSAIKCNPNKDRINWGKSIMLSKEEMKQYHYDTSANVYRDVVNPFSIDNWHYNQSLTSSSQYKDIIEYAVSEGGLLVCSRAGTGKSYMVDKAVEDKLIEDDKRCRLAFTNKARRNINGSTIHSAISIDADTEKASIKMVESFKGKKVIIVDEVSMVSQQLWTYLILLKKVSNATFILLGDYRQLPAVEDKEHNYFDSSIMKFLANNNRIELTQRQRYDKQMWDWLDNFFEDGIVGDELQKVKTIDYNAYNICYYNKTREKVNMKYMNYHKPISAEYIEHNKKDADDKASGIYLYKDLPVMSVVNKTKNKKGESNALYCNSDTMKVIDFDEKTITMKLDNADDENKDIVIVNKTDFHKSFVCNYCSTTHKNQGATIDRNIQLWDWDKMTIDRRIGYTAVSRARKMEQVKIII